MINENKAYRYCSEPLENIENYAEAIDDTKQMWDCHHRLEVNNFNASRNDGGIVSQQQLIEDGMYWNRPACELIFVTKSQHRKIHKAICSKGGNSAAAQMTFEQRSKGGKKGGKTKLGSHWFNNGIEQRHCKKCPGPGWVKGRLKRSK